MQKTLLALAAITLTGCAQLISVSTVDKIRTSQHRATLASAQPVAATASCMKDRLRSYRNSQHVAEYEAITYRDFENESEILLRNTLSSMAGTVAEIFFLIESRAATNGGTTSIVWVNPMFLGQGGSAGYLERVVGTIRPCTTPGALAAQPSAQTPAPASPGGRGSPAERLDQLKALFERGAITKDEYDQKRKQVLDAL